MGPIWDQQDPGGHHVGPMNFAIWVDAADLVGLLHKQLAMWLIILHLVKQSVDYVRYWLVKI